MNKRGREILKLNFAVLLAGATGLFGRTISLSEIPLVWYRMLFAIVVLAVMMAVGRRLHLPPLGQTMKILGCGFVLAIHWVLFYGSIKESNVSVGVICFATASFFTALLEPMVNRHRPRWKQLLFSSISLVGIMMVFSLDTRYRLGIAMGLASADAAGAMSAEMFTKVSNIAANAQVNTLEGITIAGVLAEINEAKQVDIPMATTSAAGVVKSSEGDNEINVAATGVMSVNRVGVSKLFVESETTLILDGGNSGT